MPKIEDVTVIWSSVSGALDYMKNPKTGLTPAQYEAALGKLTEDQRAAFSKSRLAWDRVPLLAVNRLTEEVAKAKGEDIEAFARRIGRHTAEKSPLLKTFAMLMTPASTLKVASQIWQKIYGAGQIKVETTPTGAIMTVSDFPSQPVGCARVSGWVEVIIEAAGGKKVSSKHTKCIARNATECVWDLTWE